MKKLIPLLVISSLALTACPQPPAPPAPAQVRFVHAVPDIAVAKLALDGTIIADAQPTYTNTYPAANNTYKEFAIPTGQTSVNVQLSFCATSASNCSATLDTKLSLQAGKKYTVIITGTNAAGDDTGSDARPVRIIQLEDNQGAPSQATRFRVRFVHAAPDVAAKLVNVYLTAPSEDLSLTSPVAANLGYAASSGTPPIERVGNNSYQTRITPTTSVTPLIDGGTTTYDAGKSYTVVVLQSGTGFPGGVIRLPDN